jgi:hypothetical protein
LSDLVREPVAIFHVPHRPPRCPDCSSANARPIIYGEPEEELGRRAERGDVVLGGCVLWGNDPAWACPECGRRFGDTEKPYKKLPERSREEWVELLTTMLPKPAHVSDVGELLGGDPVVVIVRVDAKTIEIMEAGIEADGPHTPTVKGRPFANVPLRTPTARVAELIAMAWGKRVSRYRWCPRCRLVREPEHMAHGRFCDGCLPGGCARAPDV